MGVARPDTVNWSKKREGRVSTATVLKLPDFSPSLWRRCLPSTLRLSKHTSSQPRKIVDGSLPMRRAGPLLEIDWFSPRTFAPFPHLLPHLASFRSSRRLSSTIPSSGVVDPAIITKFMNSISSTLATVAPPSYDAQPPSIGPFDGGACHSSDATPTSTHSSPINLANMPEPFRPGSLSVTSPAEASISTDNTASSLPSNVPRPSSQHVPRAWQHLVRSDFWFTDGNIVLIAGNAIFKVHRGQLERQSEMFRDLFSVPQPQSVGDPHQMQGLQQRHTAGEQHPTKQESEDGMDEGVDLIDGCHWVELHDRPSDVFYFLAALYDGL